MSLAHLPKHRKRLQSDGIAAVRTVEEMDRHLRELRRLVRIVHPLAVAVELKLAGGKTLKLPLG